MKGRAVVIGAGVGGLCAAIGLQRGGWEVTVVERWPEVTAIGAGLGVWPDAQQALDRIGVGDSFRRRAIEVGTASLFAKDGRRLCAIPSRAVERRRTPIRILPRSALLTLLLEAAGGCEIRTGVDIAEHPDIAHGADVLIGADGVQSTVRRHWFPGEAAAPRYSGFVAWRGSVPGELDDPAAYGETWGDGMLFGLTRLSPGRTNWYAALPGPADVRQPFDQVRDGFRGWRAPIPEVLHAADTDAALRHPIYDLAPHLSSYIKGNVALLGDAAHAMTPNLGRGACEAMLDAADLAGRLAGSAEVPGALAAYDRARRPAAQKMVHRSRRALQVATTRHARLRDAALTTLKPIIR